MLTDVKLIENACARYVHFNGHSQISNDISQDIIMLSTLLGLLTLYNDHEMISDKTLNIHQFSCS